MEKTQLIMVVEDEVLLLEAITRKIKAHGINVIGCASAQQALDILTSVKVLPDAIWLDYYLGDMNGLEFVQALKKNPSLSEIPIIVVSNSASDQKKNAMLALGVKKYLLKADNRLEDIIDQLTDTIK